MRFQPRYFTGGYAESGPMPVFEIFGRHLRSSPNGSLSVTRPEQPEEPASLPEVPGYKEASRENTYVSATQPPDSDPQDLDPLEGGTGLHTIIKNTDYWFNREVYQLEQFALAQAREHAEAGVPRQNAPATEILPIETVLHDRGVQLFLDWKERVRRRFQDGIQSASVKAGNGVVQLRHSLDQLELQQTNVRESKDRLQELERRVTDFEKPMEYERLLSSSWYWPVFGLLVVVDWIANVPVFAELLPHEAGEAQRWAERVAEAQTHGIWSGLLTEIYKIAFSPGPTLLAIGVVISLMFLGHICGMTLRRLIAFRQDDEVGPVLGLKSSRRQSFVPSIASGIGMIVIIFVLFFSRQLLKPVTGERLNAAKHSIASVREEKQRADAEGKDTSDITVQEARLETQIGDLQDHADYAGSISAMNIPITMLNVVLGITAVAASYLHDKAKILETRLVDPRVAAEELRLADLRNEMLLQKGRVRSLDLSIQEEIATAKYLSLAAPLRGWPAKAQRLEGTVSLFRSENACRRGVDVQNIEQFKLPPIFPLPPIEPETPFEIPLQLVIAEKEYERLHAQFEMINRRENSFAGTGEAS